MDENEIRSLLWDIVERGDFPDPSFQTKHLERIEDFVFVSDDKVSFSIDRHPHLFHRVSVGGPSSAFATETHYYELDLNKKEVIFIEKSVDNEPFINFHQLAFEDINNFFTYTYCFEFDDKLSGYALEPQVVAFAKEEVKKFDWLAGFEDQSEEFKSSFMEEIEKQFIGEVVTLWCNLKASP